MLNMIITIMAILFWHWMSDFVFQSDKLALSKERSIKYLTYHVLIYSFFMALFAFTFAHAELITGAKTHWGDSAIISWVSINAILHWIVDYFITKIYKPGSSRSSLTIVALDQLLHYLCLMSTYYLILESNI